MGLKRPRRREFDSEPAWLMACLRYLDAKHPESRVLRARAFARWEAQEATASPDRVIERLRYLVARDDLTPSEDDELDRLIDLYRTTKKHRTKGI